METPPEHKTQRWMLYLPPALLDQFRQLATEHRRSLNSELVWALEQYAKQEQRKAKREANP
ncbi:MAG TPA: Arc family DNA-binding protein [Ktedonobacterales bacterium]|jgi:hypothetical protein